MSGGSARARSSRSTKPGGGLPFCPRLRPALALPVCNDGVDDDIEERLAAAAADLREHQTASRRAENLRDRVAEMDGRLTGLLREHARECGDLERLERPSLARVLASLRGTLADALQRERAEADIAAYQVADARTRLDGLRREQVVVLARLADLADAPQAYATLLDEKERQLRASRDPRRSRLMELADERGRLGAEGREVEEALRAAATARRALVEVRDHLNSAGNWSTFDTFLGGGLVSSAVKHQRIDDAAQAARRADHQLAVLRTELADVPGLSLDAELKLGAMTRFVDVWFDNIFTDLAVDNRIARARGNVERCGRLVRQVRERLTHRAEQVRVRLAEVEAERRDLLTRR